MLEAPQFIVATGSVVPPGSAAGTRGRPDIVDSDAVLELESIPESVVVFGGGYTACELGQFLARMGARTTMLIRSGHLLTQSDDDVGDALTGYFREEGIEVVTHATLAARRSRNGGKKVGAIRSRRHASGRRRATRSSTRSDARRTSRGLDLERAGVAIGPGGEIEVDRHLRTSNPNIYAVGDVTGEYMLVHVAIYQGEVAARNACLNAERDGRLPAGRRRIRYSTDPQIAAVGVSEKELKRRGHRLRSRGATISPSTVRRNAWERPRGS